MFALDIVQLLTNIIFYLDYRYKTITKLPKYLQLFLKFLYFNK